MKRIFMVLSLISAYNMVSAQDIHFSQFSNSALHLNPGFTGDVNGNIRLTANHRNQWTRIGTPYLTNSIAADAKLLDTRWNGGFTGLGLMIYNDQSGDGGIRHVQPMLSAAVHKYIDRRKQHTLSAGVQAGIFQRSLDPAKLTFGSQYLEGDFNSGISSGENFSSYHITRFDLNAGLTYEYRNPSGHGVQIAYSLAHINHPNESFLGQSVIMPIRTVLFSQINLRCSRVLYAHTSMIWQQQDNSNEYIPGVIMSYHMRNQHDEPVILNAGISYRSEDAIIFYSGINYDKWQVGVSYDANVSTLSKASSHNGAFELSLIYNDLLIPGKSKLVPKTPCQRL